MTIGALLFLIIIPLTIAYASLALNGVFGISLSLEPYNSTFGLALIAIGLFFAGWAVWAQWNIGKGTPVPIVSTQKLVIVGPYAYCRNPMTFGVLLYYLGLILTVNALSGVIIVFAIGALLSLYIKLVEEKELELRFGKEYVEYKEKTPYLIPRPREGRFRTKLRRC